MDQSITTLMESMTTITTMKLSSVSVCELNFPDKMLIMWASKLNSA